MIADLTSDNVDVELAMRLLSLDNLSGVLSASGLYLARAISSGFMVIAKGRFLLIMLNSDAVSGLDKEARIATVRGLNMLRFP